MDLVADDHTDLGRAEQALLLDVPAMAGEKGMTGGRESREVRHRGAPVTKPTTVRESRPSTSNNQGTAARSSATATGEAIWSPDIWSQAPAIQFAASVAGSVPPVTNLK